eukprot:COSAG04_NODE_7728_length_1077_cov_6.935583_1_plen_358_part_11
MQARLTCASLRSVWFRNVITETVRPAPTCHSYTVRWHSTPGSFTDGSGSGNRYANDKDCAWKLECPSGQSVQLSFSSFDTESNFDFVTLYDGESASSDRLGRFSGSESRPGTTTSSGRYMRVRFTTDGSVTRSGWSASWACTSSPPSYCDGRGGITRSYRFGGDPSCRDACSLCSAAQVVAVMAAAPGDRDVQRHGCNALGNLVTGSPANRAAIADAGGIDAVVGAMTRFPDDRDVQYHGCFALAMLAEDSPANGAAIREAGGVAALSAADGTYHLYWCQAALDTIPADPCAGVVCGAHGTCVGGACEYDRATSGAVWLAIFAGIVCTAGVILILYAVAVNICPRRQDGEEQAGAPRG